MKINEIEYFDLEGRPRLETIGQFGVKEIKEVVPTCEADKFFYEIYYKDKTILRIFNPDKIRYMK